MTAHLRPRRPIPDQLRTLFSPRSFGYDRVAAVVNLVDRLVPGSGRKAAAKICRPMELPFRTTRVELLSFGSGATVFLAMDGAAAPARVVKVYRRSFGVPRDRLPELLEMHRGKYEEVRRLYRDAPGVVWPAEYMIIRGPILNRPAVACVQEFIPEGLRDFFSDVSEEQALAAMESSPELRRQFLAFAGPTLELYRREGRCPDFVGHCNLALAGDGAAARLRLIDCRIMTASPGQAPQHRRLQRIATLLDEIRK